MGTKPRPLFTVITPTLNCVAYLPRNIASVRSQGLMPDEWEHWVIDGGSTDGTQAYLAETPHLHWLSEPDRGLSDAVNKGLARSTGQWIVWLNADDQLCPNALRTIRDYAARFPEIRIFCGDLQILRYDGTPEQIVRGWAYTFEELVARRPGINQPATVVHREVVERVGGLDVNVRYAMDYEWMVRAVREFACLHIPQVLAIYQRRRGSIMDAHMAHHFRTFRAVRRRYGRPRTEYLEWLIWFYLATEPLRRIRPLRRLVRWIKRVLGREPLHPL